MKISNLKRDSEAVEAGEWVTDLPGAEDLRLKVRGLTSRAFIDAQSKRNRSVAMSDRNTDGTIKTEIAMAIYNECIHETILLDWENLTGEDGKPISYDPRLAQMWLTDPDFYDFQNVVFTAASRVDAKRKEQQETVSKN